MAQFQILVRGEDGTFVPRTAYFDDELTARPGEAGWTTDPVETYCRDLAKSLKVDPADVAFSYICTPNWRPPVEPEPEDPTRLTAETVAVLAELALWEIEDPKGFQTYQAHMWVRAEFAALASVADDATKEKLDRILEARLAALA